MEQLAQLKSQDIENLTKTGAYIFVFTATWCGDCRVLAPFLPQIEADYPEFHFIEVDRDQFMDLAQKWQVFGIPSFIAIKDGKEIGRFVSKDRKTKKQVEDFIDSL